MSSCVTEEDVAAAAAVAVEARTGKDCGSGLLHSLDLWLGST